MPIDREIIDREIAAYVADLLWAINSPTLMDFREKTWEPSRIDPDQFDHNALWNSMQPRVHRVGYYFEQLISFYLSHNGVDQLLAEQIQIISNGRTVGEIDFLFRDGSGQICHLETSTKFFLCLPDGLYGGSRLVGPNSNDNFERKANHLLKHQLTLSSKFPLSHKGKPIQVDRHLAMVKGRIYHHIDSSKNLLTVDHLAQNHLQGTWLRMSEWNAERFASTTQIRLLQKPHWLSDANATDPIKTSDFGKFLVKHFSQTHRPIHGYINGTPGLFFFVVADHWPDRI